MFSIPTDERFLLPASIDIASSARRVVRFDPEPVRVRLPDRTRDRVDEERGTPRGEIRPHPLFFFDGRSDRTEHDSWDDVRRIDSPSPPRWKDQRIRSCSDGSLKMLRVCLSKKDAMVSFAFFLTLES